MAEVLVGPGTPRLRAYRIVLTNVTRYMLLGSLRNWIRNAGSTAPALGSMTLLLVLVGMAAMGGLVARSAADTEAANASILHVYLADTATPDQVDALRNKLAADPSVRSVKYVSKAEALARAQHRPGLTELAAASESNPFPASLDVKVATVDKVGHIDALVRKDPAVDKNTVPTSYDPAAYRRFQQVMWGVGAGLVAFLLLLGFIAVTVTANSIRAAILSRHDEISIMQLVGAPRWMVGGPFVVEGALTGTAAGVMAACLALLLAYLAVQAGAASFAQLAPGLTLQAAVGIAFLLALVGPILGSASSLSGLGRHLEQ